MENVLKKRARAGINSYGLNIGLCDPIIIEMAAYAGYDFVRIDCEHSLFNEETVSCMIRAARLLNLPVQVRVSNLSRVSALLDMGADGIMIPHVGSAEEAARAVTATKYSPIGLRGLSSASRALDFGKATMNEYAARANDEVNLIIQIEDKAGLENIDEIFSVAGVDMVATGKSDLSQALGVIGQNRHPDVISAENLIIEKALEHGIIPTLLVTNVKRAHELSNRGVHCFTVGRDEKILFSGMKDSLSAYREKEIKR